MELSEAIQTGRELAEYFVYCCGEGDHYVELIERLRAARTRSTLVEAIYVLIRYGSLHLKHDLQNVNVDRQNIKNLFRFILKGKSDEISQFHSSLSIHIWDFELENIQQQERYLLELLT